MNKQVKGRKFGRERKVRRSFLKSLVVNLVRNGKIKTTDARAKEIRPIVEKIVTRAKTDTLANRRLVIEKVGIGPVKELFGNIGPRYKERKGGYTRIIKLPARKGDASEMAVIEFV